MAIKEIIKKMKNGELTNNEGLVKIISAEIANGNYYKIPIYIDIIFPALTTAEFLDEPEEYCGKYDPALQEESFEDIPRFMRAKLNEASADDIQDIISEIEVAEKLIYFGTPYEWWGYLDCNWHLLSTSKNPQSWPEQILRLSTPLTLTEEQLELLQEIGELEQEEIEKIVEWPCFKNMFFFEDSAEKLVDEIIAFGNLTPDDATLALDAIGIDENGNYYAQLETIRDENESNSQPRIRFDGCFPPYFSGETPSKNPPGFDD